MRNAFLGLALASLGVLFTGGCGDNARAQGSDPMTPPRVTPAPAVTEEKALPVDAFLKSIVGEYDILEAGPVGGDKQPFKDYVGTVEVDGKDMLFTFPYCPPQQGCLPGYAYFSLASATVATRVDKSLTFQVMLDDGTRGTFRWSEDSGHIVFVNEQLEHSDGTRKAIEYHLRAR